MRNTLKFQRLRILFPFILILICASSLHAQKHYNVSQFTDETLDFFKQPGKWRGNDWLKLGLIATGSVLVMQVDEPVRRAVLKDQGRYYHSIPIETGRIWGDENPWIVVRTGVLISRL